MTCAWESLLQILPQWLRQTVNDQDRDRLQEIRLRMGSNPELIFPYQNKRLRGTVRQEDLQHCIYAASRYSPWTAESAAQGYITGPGGHRIGLCGEGVCRNGQASGIRDLRSVCIRVARDVPGISRFAPESGSVLILGAPGWGKTTLLRDLIRRRSRFCSVSVVDERRELFPAGFDTGCRIDVLTGIPKATGIDMVLRTMGPECIAVDEITAEADSLAIQKAAGCGVTLLATAHAGSVQDFLCRPLYRELIQARIFTDCLVLNRDQTYKRERMSEICCV